jgi:hybrid cluster-associated redox disulfide protein
MENKKIEKIKKDSLINETIQKYPSLAEDFFMLGMMCIGCPMSQAETIEQGCQVHGMTDKQIQEFIEMLNKKLDKKSKKKTSKKPTKKKVKKK